MGGYLGLEGTMAEWRRDPEAGGSKVIWKVERAIQVVWGLLIPGLYCSEKAGKQGRNGGDLQPLASPPVAGQTSVH